MAIIIFGVLMAITLVFSEPAQSNDNTITIECDKSVDRGVIIMDSTPIMNCKDMRLLKFFIGSGLEVGPILDIDRFDKNILEAVKKLEMLNSKTVQVNNRKDVAFKKLQ
jgi:hypothetical protein